MVKHNLFLQYKLKYKVILVYNAELTLNYANEVNLIRNVKEKPRL